MTTTGDRKGTSFYLPWVLLVDRLVRIRPGFAIARSTRRQGLLRLIRDQPRGRHASANPITIRHRRKTFHGQSLEIHHEATNARNFTAKKSAIVEDARAFMS
jgi:hypothetical protein